MKQQTSIEELVCTLFFLLTRYARSPEPHLPAVIRDHLNWLANHPDVDNFPTLRKTCDRLALYWQPDQNGDLAPNPSSSVNRRRSDLH